MKKRELLVGLASLLTSCSPDNGPRLILKKESNFILASDPHYYSSSLRKNGFTFDGNIVNDGVVADYTPTIFDCLLDRCREAKADALFLTGDITSSSDRLSHLEVVDKLKKLEKDGVLVYVIPGNHDAGHYPAYSYDGSMAYPIEKCKYEAFKEMYGRFGYNEARFKDERTFSYITPLAEGVYGVFFDANASFMNYTYPSTLHWLEESLKILKEEKAKIISFSHQNLYSSTDFELISKSKEMISLYKEYGIKANFSGHQHIQHIYKGEYFPEIITSALSVSPCGYATLSYKDQEFLYETKRLDVEKYAKDQGYKDPKLLDFSNFADDYFERNNNVRLVEGLEEDNSLTITEKESLIPLIKKTNKAYFLGDRIDFSSFKEEIRLLNEKLSSLDTGSPIKGVLNYTKEVLDDMAKGVDHHRLLIGL